MDALRPSSHIQTLNHLNWFSVIFSSITAATISSQIHSFCILTFLCWPTSLFSILGYTIEGLIHFFTCIFLLNWMRILAPLWWNPYSYNCKNDHFLSNNHNINWNWNDPFLFSFHLLQNILKSWAIRRWIILCIA